MLILILKSRGLWTRPKSYAVMLCASVSRLPHIKAQIRQRNTSLDWLTTLPNPESVISEINVGQTGSRRALESICLCFSTLCHCRWSPRGATTPVCWWTSTFKQQLAWENLDNVYLRHSQNAFMIYVCQTYIKPLYIRCPINLDFVQVTATYASWAAIRDCVLLLKAFIFHMWMKLHALWMWLFKLVWIFKTWWWHFVKVSASH